MEDDMAGVNEKNHEDITKDNKDIQVAKLPEQEYFPDYITENLMFLGIMPKMIGFDYLREAVKLCFIDKNLLKQVTSKLYPMIAKKFHTSSEVVERNMRSAIENAHNSGGLLNLNQYFSLLIYKQNFRISNSELISIIIEKIKLDLFENAFKLYNIQN